MKNTSKKGITTSIYLDTRKKRKDGNYPVKLRETYKSRSRFYSTKYSLIEDDFDKVMGEKPRGDYKDLKLEFAKIEKITSKNFDLTIKPYKMSDLLEASEDMLMIENPKRFITTKIVQDYSLDVDFELFTLVVKNLLDNGIKYSTDKQITVIIDDNKLKIINKGEALKEPLENYFKPFHTSKQGLG